MSGKSSALAPRPAQGLAQIGPRGLRARRNPRFLTEFLALASALACLADPRSAEAQPAPPADRTAPPSAGPAKPNPKPPSDADDDGADDDTDDEGTASEGTAKGAEDDDEDEDEDEDDRFAAGKPAGDGVDPDLARMNSRPAPAEPRPGDQGPGVVPASPPLRPLRTVDFGPVFGLTHRAAGEHHLSYGSGFTWGAFARVDLWPFLAVRLTYLNSKHEINGQPRIDGGRRGAYPSLLSYTFRATLEPTWALDELRVFGILGVGWGKLRIEQISDEGGFELASAQNGVLLEYPLGIGASYDLLDGWLSLGALYTFSLHSKTTGAVYNTSTGITQAGERVAIEGLPEPTSTQLWVFTAAVVF